jgi:hypothetical protein
MNKKTFKIQVEKTPSLSQTFMVTASDVGGTTSFQKVLVYAANQISELGSEWEITSITKVANKSIIDADVG